MPGGFVKELSERALANLKKHVPQMPPKEFAWVIWQYSFDRQQRPAPKEVRDRLSQMSGAAQDLHSLLSGQSHDVRLYLRNAIGSEDDITLTSELSEHLSRFAILATRAQAAAAKNSKAGRATAALTKMIYRLAHVLEREG